MENDKKSVKKIENKNDKEIKDDALKDAAGGKGRGKRGPVSELYKKKHNL